MDAEKRKKKKNDERELTKSQQYKHTNNVIRICCFKELIFWKSAFRNVFQAGDYVTEI